MFANIIGIKKAYSNIPGTATKMEAGRTFDVEVGIETVRVEEEEFVAFFFASRIKSMNCGSTPCNNKLSRETEEDERMDVVVDVPSVLLVSEVDFDN